MLKDLIKLISLLFCSVLIFHEISGVDQLNSLAM